MSTIGDDGTGYHLLLSFDGLYRTMPEEHAFVNGVQVGELWFRMRGGQEAKIEMTTHYPNREVVKRMAAAEGWDLNVEASGTQGWDFTTLTKTRAAKLNPQGLAVIQGGRHGQD